MKDKLLPAFDSLIESLEKCVSETYNDVQNCDSITFKPIYAKTHGQLVMAMMTISAIRNIIDLEL
jgi:hypothetical protein